MLNIVTGPKAGSEEMWSVSRQGQEIFLHPKTSKRTQGSIPLPIQREPEIIPPGLHGQGVKLGTHLNQCTLNFPGVCICKFTFTVFYIKIRLMH